MYMYRHMHGTNPSACPGKDENRDNKSLICYVQLFLDKDVCCNALIWTSLPASWTSLQSKMHA